MLLKKQFPYEKLREQAANLQPVIIAVADDFISTIFNILKNSNDEIMQIRIELITNLKQYVKLCGAEVNTLFLFVAKHIY